MALQLSDALRNAILNKGSFAGAFQGGVLEMYSGSQPANANAAPTGTLLCVITVGSASRTPEVAAAGSVTLTGGSSGSVNTLTVSGIEVMGQAVPFNTSLAQTASDVADTVNKNPNIPVIASASGAVVTLTAKPGFGNVTWTVASATTTLTKTDANMSGGTTQVNGLRFNGATGGTMVKDPAQTWSGVGVADGTAGWFRLKASKTDAGALDGAAVYTRMDGTAGTSGANLNLTSTSIATGATITITSFSPTEPAA
jgi:hypothetical protein